MTRQRKTHLRISLLSLVCCLLFVSVRGLAAEGEVSISKREAELLKLIPAHLYSIPDPLSGQGKRKATFNQPMSVAVDESNGNIFVSDASNRIQIFSEEGALLGGFGSTGGQPGQFNVPISLFIDQKQKQLYVLDQRNWRVQVFKISENLLNANNESEDEDQGEADEEEGAVRPVKIIPLPVGTVPQLGEQAIIKKNGKQYPTRSMDIATDSFGKIIVLDGGAHRFLLYNSDGEFLTKFGQVGKARDKFYFPKSFDLAVVDYVDQKNRKKKRIQYYVADTINRRVAVVTEKGEFQFLIGANEKRKADFSMPTGIALDDQLNIYVLDRMGAECHVFDKNGERLFSFGQENDLYEKLYLPLQVAVSSKRKRIYITDMGNERLMVYRMGSK